jgi:hypothetical protein
LDLWIFDEQQNFISETGAGIHIGITHSWNGLQFPFPRARFWLKLWLAADADSFGLKCSN